MMQGGRVLHTLSLIAYCGVIRRIVATVFASKQCLSHPVSSRLQLVTGARHQKEEMQKLFESQISKMSAEDRARFTQLQGERASEITEKLKDQSLSFEEKKKRHPQPTTNERDSGRVETCVVDIVSIS